MRLNLIVPQGSLIEPSTYNQLFTVHGLIMIFFFLAPSIPAVLGNFLIPLMIGAKDVAFPRLNLLSWYIFMAGGTVFLYSVIVGGVDTGWTFYTPLSSTYANSNVMSAAMGVFISGFSSILTGLNFIVTIHTMRAPGLTWFRLPLFLWSLYATSIIFILAMPVIAITMVLLMLERFLHFGFFDPALGGDPILFQHLFWFFGHPEVYVLVLPAMGVVSELIRATHSQKENLWLRLRRVFECGHCSSFLPGVGSPHVRQWGVPLRRGWFFSSLALPSQFLQQSKSSTGRLPFIRDRFRSKLRCSMLWGSLLSLRWED